MGWDYLFLLVCILALVSHVNAATTELGAGCIFGDPVDSDPYFNVAIYPYLGNYQDTNYVANGYTSASQITTYSSISINSLTWNSNPDNPGFVYEMTGYFFAPETGLYVLSFIIEPQYDQESVMVWLGSDMAFECCQQQIPPDSADGNLMFVNSYSASDGYVLLDAGVYYPMRVVLVSAADAGFQMLMETPSESFISVPECIFQMANFGLDCTSATVVTTSTTSEYTAATLYWTGSNTFTSTYVFTTTDSSNVVHVVTESAQVVPLPSLLTTDVPSTTTIVSEYTAIDTTLGATPYVTTGNVVLVPSFVASTTSEYTSATLYWTGSNTFTSTYLFTTTDSSSNVHVVTASAEVIPAPPVFTTDVPSTTTVVTEYTAIDTTLGATPYVTTGNVVLVPRSSAGSDSTSGSASTAATSGTTGSSSTSTFETTTSETTTSYTTSTTYTSTSETTTFETTTPETTTSETTASEAITRTTTPTTTSGEVSYGTYIWTGTSTKTLTLTYINDELYVPATGLYKRADSTSLSIVVLIPTPTYWAFTDGQSVVVLTIPELLPNGQTATVPLTFHNTAYFPSVTTSNTIAPSNTYITVTTTSTSFLPTTVTSIVTTTNAQGSTVTEAVVIIVEDNSLSTTTTFGTQATIFTSVYTGTDGRSTTDIIVVRVPTNGTRTITVAGTSSFTKTTLCTTTNAAGVAVTITDVVVYCPEDNYHEPHVVPAHDTTVIDKVTEVITLSCTTYTDEHGKLTSYTTRVTDYVVVPKTLSGPTTYTYPVGSVKPAEASSYSAPQPSDQVEVTLEGAGNSLQDLGMGAAAAAMFAFALF